MNAEKYTQKALEAVKTEQNMAQENGNQYLTTEHLLYALLDQDGGLIGSLFGKMGVDCDGLLSELDTLIRNLPRRCSPCCARCAWVLLPILSAKAHQGLLSARSWPSALGLAWAAA